MLIVPSATSADDQPEDLITAAAGGGVPFVDPGHSAGDLRGDVVAVISVRRNYDAVAMAEVTAQEPLKP